MQLLEFITITHTVTSSHFQGACEVSHLCKYAGEVWVVH